MKFLNYKTAKANHNTTTQKVADKQTRERRGEEEGRIESNGKVLWKCLQRRSRNSTLQPRRFLQHMDRFCAFQRHHLERTLYVEYHPCNQVHSLSIPLYFMLLSFVQFSFIPLNFFLTPDYLLIPVWGSLVFNLKLHFYQRFFFLPFSARFFFFFFCFFLGVRLESNVLYPAVTLDQTSITSYSMNKKIVFVCSQSCFIVALQ